MGVLFEVGIHRDLKVWLLESVELLKGYGELSRVGPEVAWDLVEERTWLRARSCRYLMDESGKDRRKALGWEVLFGHPLIIRERPKELPTSVAISVSSSRLRCTTGVELVYPDTRGRRPPPS